jgi:hypothetical protein
MRDGEGLGFSLDEAALAFLMAVRLRCVSAAFADKWDA